MKAPLVLLASAACAASAHAQTITNVTVTPSPPYDCVPMVVTIFGTYPSPNYTTSNFAFGLNSSGDTLTLSYNATGSGSSSTTPFSQPIPPVGPVPAGTYVLHVRLLLNNVPAPNGNWYVNLTVLDPSAFDPGLDGDSTLCNAGPSLPLVSMLEGAPQSGGQWFDPFNAPHSPTFVPGPDPQGIYLYCGNAPAPCVNPCSQLIISYLPNNNPGVSTNANLCVTSAPVNLFNILQGSPMSGGTWTAPGGLPFAGIYDPAIHNPGVYTYTVTGLPPCPGPWATVTVSETPLSNAGQDGTAQICSDDHSALLFSYLAGGAQPNGAWADPLGQFFGFWNVELDAAVASEGDYTYIVFSSVCPNDSATLEVVYVPPCFNGIAELDASGMNMELTPNPTNALVDITLAGVSPGSSVRIEVMNASGTLVRQTIIGTGPGNMASASIDLSDEASGLYLVRAITPTRSSTRRLLRE